MMIRGDASLRYLARPVLLPILAAALLVWARLAAWGGPCNSSDGSDVTVTFESIDRLYPGEARQVSVTVSPDPLPGSDAIDLSCPTQDGTSGSAEVSPSTITRSTTVTVTAGQEQSWDENQDKASPNNITLTAKLHGCVAATEPFTVCSHVKGVANQKTKDLEFGLEVSISWESDTGANCDDLDKCEFQEDITYSKIPNPPFRQQDGSDLAESERNDQWPKPPLSGTVGDDGTTRDVHWVGLQFIAVPPKVEHYTLDQDYEFRCERCNSDWITAETYRVKFEIYDSDGGAGEDLKFRTTKTGHDGPFESDKDVPGY